MRRGSHPLSLWFDAATTMNAAAMTIAVRVLRMQQAMLLGDLSGGAEARRMVSEKLVAAQKGYWSGLQSATALMLSPPASYWNAAADITNAMLQPGARKARANARRLTKFRRSAVNRLRRRHPAARSPSPPALRDRLYEDPAF